MKYFFRKTIIKLLAFIFIIAIFSLTLTGCVSAPTGLYIENYPIKQVYQVGEVPTFDGLKIKTINTDGTHRMVYLNQNELPKIDTSTSGVKTVVINKGLYLIALLN